MTTLCHAVCDFQPSRLELPDPAHIAPIADPADICLACCRVGGAGVPRCDLLHSLPVIRDKKEEWFPLVRPGGFSGYRIKNGYIKGHK